MAGVMTMPQHSARKEAASAIYLGAVMHKRLRPFVHEFQYRVFSLYLDLDEVPDLARRLHLFSHNRWNLFSLHDRDHGARDGAPLRAWIERHLRGAGIDLAGGRIRVLCFPRVLGYVFNPISIWFCYHADGELRAILYEVCNTFGESHSYLAPVTPANRPRGAIAQSGPKLLYVSPFMGMNARYDFRLAEPGERLSILIQQWVPEGAQLVAKQTGRRRALSDGALLRAFFAYPLVTLKVIGAIHWEAARLWLKGARAQDRPPPPCQEVTLITPVSLAAAE